MLSETCQIDGLEDIYELFLGRKKDGYFVEFGAYDGEYVSNTSGLADIGWNGLYIEPVTLFYDKVKERHKGNNVSIVKCAVSDKKGDVKINIGGVLSTIDDNMVDTFNSMDWSKNLHKGEFEIVKTRLLNDIFHEVSVPLGFDVLSVDIEGHEWTALKDFDMAKYKPKIVIIELHDNNKNYAGNEEDLITYFNDNKYRVIYKDFTNTVYIRHDLLKKV